MVTWPALANGDDGTPISFSQYTDKSVQVSGTFGVGGTLRFEGSNNDISLCIQITDLDLTSGRTVTNAASVLYGEYK